MEIYGISHNDYVISVGISVIQAWNGAEGVTGDSISVLKKDGYCLIEMECTPKNSSRDSTSAVGSDEPSCIPTGSLKPAVSDNTLSAQAQSASNTSQEEIGEYCESCSRKDTGYVCPVCGLPIIETRTRQLLP